MPITEPTIIFDESVLPLLKEHQINNMIQFFVNQLLINEDQGTYSLHTEHCEIYITKYKTIIYVSK